MFEFRKHAVICQIEGEVSRSESRSMINRGSLRHREPNIGLSFEVTQSLELGMIRLRARIIDLSALRRNDENEKGAAA
jgi:hypothetical protein